MTVDPAFLERLDRLHGVQVARAILREAFGVELQVVSSEGPAAHARGGVLTSSSEACRVSLFARDGFERCDALYRELGVAAEASARVCHLGLSARSEPVLVDGAVVAHVVASGYSPGREAGFDAAATARALLALDAQLVDPADVVRRIPVVRPDRHVLVDAALRAAAREIAAHVVDDAQRTRGATGRDAFWGMIGASPQMREVFLLLSRVVDSHATVLVQGESGTGKELVAQALHAHGPRKARPFVAQNCAAMSDDLLETTLFGHVRGAFSGAVRQAGGLFAAADRGTLFLDEVGDMSPALQVKLLRVLQDGTYLPVGGTEPRRADVRVIAASHRDLGKLVAEGAFRQDLFYRLHVLTVRLPALRERQSDLRLLVPHFVELEPEVPRVIGDAAWRCLERYAWPGNVRELRAEVARWSVTARGAQAIGPEHLSPDLRAAGGFVGERGGAAAAAAAAGDGTLEEAVEALERAIFVRGLERTAGNRSRLAEELGISRSTLHAKLKRYRL